MGMDRCAAGMARASRSNPAGDRSSCPCPGAGRNSASARATRPGRRSGARRAGPSRLGQRSAEAGRSRPPSRCRTWPKEASPIYRAAFPGAPSGRCCRADFALLRPQTLSIAAEGAQRLRSWGAQYPLIRRTGWTPRCRWDPARRRKGRTSGRAISRRTCRPGKEAARRLTVGFLQARLEIRPSPPQGEPALAFAISAEGIGLPPGTRWPLGSRVSSVSVEGALDGPVPRAANWGWAALWRDGGGTLAIEHFALGWGPLGLSASATLALDEQLQPRGAANARLVGYAEALDALAANGAITRRADIAAKAILSLIARAPENGDSPRRSSAHLAGPHSRCAKFPWPASPLAWPAG